MSVILARIRIAFGAIFLLRTIALPISIGWPQPPGPLWGWPESGFHFALVPLPSAWVAALCVLRTAAVVAFTAGVRPRETGVAAGLLGYVAFTQDELSFAGSLHLLFLGIIVVALAHHDDAKSGVRLIQWFVVSIYLWAAVAKLQPHWLDGQILERLRDDGMLRHLDALLATNARRVATAMLVVFGELTIGIGLLLPRTRRGAIVAAIAMHIAFQVFARPDAMGLGMIVLLSAMASSADATAPVRSRAQ